MPVYKEKNGTWRVNYRYAVEHQIIIIGDALVTSDCFLKK